MDKKETSNSYSHILKYTSIFGGVQGLVILIGMVRNKLIALLLGPQGMGLMALFNSTVRLISDTTGLGLGMSAVRELSRLYDEEHHEELKSRIELIRSWSLITACLGFVLCVVLSPLINHYTFSWGNHTLHFMLLAPIIALTALSAGELSILKATRKLRRLAEISIYGVLCALATSVPLYYIFGESAIVPSLIIIALSQFIITITYSFHYYPYRVHFDSDTFSEAKPMLRLGISFLGAGIMGSGSDFIVRSFLNYEGSLDDVGLYNAGYMITMTYAGVIFSAMETDYFPRLSSVNNNVEERNLLVNRQLEVSLLLISPLLILLMSILPIALPLLYSDAFLAVLPMVKVAIFAMFMRSLELPVAYITLSRGDSKAFFLLETTYYLLFIMMFWLGYKYAYLWGVGLGLVVTGLLFNIILYAFAYQKYSFCISKRMLLYLAIQLSLAGLVYFISSNSNTLLSWSIQGASIVTSSCFSFYILRNSISGIFKRK
ncbi:MAG: oligosaccharide flippase family protein [Prevotella sp.]